MQLSIAPLRRSFLALLLLAGCADSGGPGSDGGTNGGGDGGPGADGSTDPGGSFPKRFLVATVETGNTGFQPSIARAPDGTLGIAYLRQAGNAPCANSPDGQPMAILDVMYTSSPDGETWSAPELVGTAQLVSMAGVAVAFDDQSRPAIAWMGGPSDLMRMRCGASDLELSRKMGASWTTVMADDDGVATPVFAEDVAACAAAQNYCNFASGVQGVVGLWPAMVYQDGDFAITYRDIHQGIAQDDEQKSDLELTWNGQFMTIDATWGGGNFSQIVGAPGNKLYVAHYRRQSDIGIWLQKYDGSAWSRQWLSREDLVGYKLSLAAFGEKVALAYHASGDQKLRYIESADGTTWGTEVTVDQSGNTGRSPSLAFSPTGLAAISYHHCGDYDPNAMNCPQDQDALRYALFEGGRWRYVDAVESRGGVDGEYTSMTFNSQGMPVIAFQATFFDPIENRVDRQLRVARGVNE
ncbi:MAG: hypothetical protein IT384_05220 [Deltaproteobacteria bacterium]|nr:hypothetical protein [Deltaproteobacteria bacterium]